MSSQRKITPVIGITLGDPAGIGPEVLVKALPLLRSQKTSKYLIIGQESVSRHYRFFENHQIQLYHCPTQNFSDIQIGRSNRDSAKASLQYLQTALHLLKDKKIHALVTGPVSKEGIASLGVKFQGHTEFLAQAFRVKKFAMMFVSKKLRIVIVTRHIPIKSLSHEITTTKVFDALNLTHATLRSNFHIAQPEIAVCGLNPHAGEGGHIGKEEIKKINPAIRRAQRAGINVKGPFPADTLFSGVTAQHYDAIIAMYHDQGLIPIKTLFFDELVNMTIGLPFVRTSPAHGTAFNIAGQNKASPGSMIAAIKLATALTAGQSL
jgi:4-hydroxythreonine-4-phosphate dehydrogenase